jgi:hypothetical protein
VGLDTHIAGVVAALDLKLVRLVRGAMNNGPGGPAPAGLVGPAATFEGRRTIEPEPRIAPRPVIHPTPRFEPRPVIRPEPRVDAPNCPCIVVEVVVDPCETKSPIEPPWRVLPWETAIEPADAESLTQPAHRVKPPIRWPDIVGKGALIDLFC